MIRGKHVTLGIRAGIASPYAAADCINAERANLNGDTTLDGDDIQGSVGAFLAP